MVPRDDSTFDVAFIGGGLACTFTWEALLPATLGKKLSFAMFDRDGAFGKGVPYGTYADPAYLLNDFALWNDTTAGDLGWIQWLRREKPRWLAKLEASDDPAVAYWLARNRDAIARDEIERIYLPRCVFGEFLEERWERHLARVQAQGHRFRLFASAVTDVEREPDGTFVIRSAGSVEPIRARAVLLGIGLLVGNRWPHLNGAPGYISIHDVHTSQLAARIAAARPGTSELAIGILGGGPSAVEMTYRWLTHPSLASRVRKLVLVTTSGDIPRVGTETTSPVAFEPVHLAALANDTAIDAQRIYEALRDDAAHVRATGFPWLAAFQSLLGHLFPLVKLLTDDEKRRWLHVFAEPVVSILKSTSMDYEQLVRSRVGDQVVIRSGRVETVTPAGEQFEVTIADRDGKRTQERFDVVLNCLGTTDLRTAESPLLAKLLERKLVRINDVGRGVHVAEGFIASPGFFVLGPLLSGAFDGKFMCMRMESITVTLMYSSQVAASLIKQL